MAEIDSSWLRSAERLTIGGDVLRAQVALARRIVPGGCCGPERRPPPRSCGILWSSIRGWAIGDGVLVANVFRDFSRYLVDFIDGRLKESNAYGFVGELLEVVTCAASVKAGHIVEQTDRIDHGARFAVCTRRMAGGEIGGEALSRPSVTTTITRLLW